MLFVPMQVGGMANTLEPSVEATRHHARQIAGAGFEPGHAGRDYLEQGRKLAAGVDGIVAMLHSWSHASDATVAALRHAVTTTVSVDDRGGARISGLGGSLGQP
jgi:hypothetical protein